MVHIEKILCPVDFFPASLRAADYAATLAASYEAQLLLLHVVSPMVYSAEPYALNIADYVDAQEEQASREMKELVCRLAGTGVDVEGNIRTGNVEREILATIEAEQPDLLVMGTHGRRGLEKWFLGSVTERMLRRSPVPMLTMGESGKPNRIGSAAPRILVTTDFSDGTREALAYGLSLAQESQAKVTLLHVMNNRTAEALETAGPSLVKSVKDRLEKMIPAGVRDWCDVRTRVETGNPYQTILDVAESDGIDLLVMNIHGKGMIHRALVGSTAERVVRGASFPVLLIPPAREAKSGRKPAQPAA